MGTLKVNKIESISGQDLEIQGKIVVQGGLEITPFVTPTKSAGFCGCYYYSVIITGSDTISATGNTNTSLNNKVFVSYASCDGETAGIYTFTGSGEYINVICVNYLYLDNVQLFSYENNQKRSAIDSYTIPTNICCDQIPFTPTPTSSVTLTPTPTTTVTKTPGLSPSSTPTPTETPCQCREIRFINTGVTQTIDPSLGFNFVYLTCPDGFFEKVDLLSTSTGDTYCILGGLSNVTVMLSGSNWTYEDLGCCSGVPPSPTPTPTNTTTITPSSCYCRQYYFYNGNCQATLYYQDCDGNPITQVINPFTTGYTECVVSFSSISGSFGAINWGGSVCCGTPFPSPTPTLTSVIEDCYVDILTDCGSTTAYKVGIINGKAAYQFTWTPSTSNSIFTSLSGNIIWDPINNRWEFGVFGSSGYIDVAYLNVNSSVPIGPTLSSWVRVIPSNQYICGFITLPNNDPCCTPVSPNCFEYTFKLRPNVVSGTIQVIPCGGSLQTISLSIMSYSSITMCVEQIPIPYSAGIEFELNGCCDSLPTTPTPTPTIPCCRRWYYENPNPFGVEIRYSTCDGSKYNETLSPLSTGFTEECILGSPQYGVLPSAATINLIPDDCCDAITPTPTESLTPTPTPTESLAPTPTPTSVTGCCEGWHIYNMTPARSFQYVDCYGNFIVTGITTFTTLELCASIKPSKLPGDTSPGFNVLPIAAVGGTLVCSGGTQCLTPTPTPTQTNTVGVTTTPTPSVTPSITPAPCSIGFNNLCFSGKYAVQTGYFNGRPTFVGYSTPSESFNIFWSNSLSAWVLNIITSQGQTPLGQIGQLNLNTFLPISTQQNPWFGTVPIPSGSCFGDQGFLGDLIFNTFEWTGSCPTLTPTPTLTSTPTTTNTPYVTQTPTKTTTKTPTNTSTTAFSGSPTPTPTITNTLTPTPTTGITSCPCYPFDVYIDLTELNDATGNPDPSEDNKIFLQYGMCRTDNGYITMKTYTESGNYLNDVCIKSEDSKSFILYYMSQGEQINCRLSSLTQRNDCCE